VRRRKIAHRTGAVSAAATRVCGVGRANPASKSSYGAGRARIGESSARPGRNISVAELRSNGEFVLVDVDAAPSDPSAPSVIRD
jgi:hypothetical protein